MSSIIDDLIDLDYKRMSKTHIRHQKESLIYQLSKSLNNSYGSLIRRKNVEKEEISIKI